MRILDRPSRKNVKLIIKKLITIGTILFVCTTLISTIGCAKEETTREGYRTYSKYGFYFEYPQHFLLFEQGMLESHANDISGIVSAIIENEEIEGVFVSWIKAQEAFVELEGLLDGFFEGIEHDETVASFERGELVETTKAGHPMLYHYYTVVDTEGEKAFGIVGTWYCDKDQKVYMLYTLNNTISSKGDVLTDYESYLDYFVCH